MASFDREAIRKRVAEVAQREMELDPAVAKDVGFHMTDWMENLEEWVEFCSDPAAMTDDAVEQMLSFFLAHVPNHIAAAAKLYMDIPVTDVFGVGAITENDNDDE